ncbi:MAG TPA: response regulator [Verrucomicrobiales bacterium]|nr:response regulator [Verrucomicrobiales bacterium]
MTEETGTIEVFLDRFDLSPKAIQDFPELKPGPHAMLRFCDDGKGMDSSVCDQVFDPFFTTKAKEKGTGLGMSVVMGIIKSHGGAVRVESEIGNGTTLRIYFPFPERPMSLKKENAETTPLGKGQKVLVVDDEVSISENTVWLLKKLNYDSNMFASGTELRAQIKDEPNAYQLLITDFTMSDINGIQLAREIRKLNPSISVILVTGALDKWDERTAVSSGVDGLLAKPFTLAQLAESVDRILGKEPRKGATTSAVNDLL